jgi:hypothetical protein
MIKGIETMENSNKQNVKILADDHWAYVKNVITRHEQTDAQIDIAKVIELIGFHYRSALGHGYKHGLKDGYKQGLEAARKGNNV